MEEDIIGALIQAGLTAEAAVTAYHNWIIGIGIDAIALAIILIIAARLAGGDGTGGPTP